MPEKEEHQETRDLAAREIARTVARMDQRGHVLRALISVLQGKATAHIATRDADGKVSTEPMPDIPGRKEGVSPRRRAQLEALRDGLYRSQLGLESDDGPYVEEAPFSEIFVELWNEDPPFVEGPISRTGMPDPQFREFPGMHPFFELPPLGPRPDPAPVSDLEPWNENPPFVEGPWNEDPPFVEGPWNEDPPFVERAASEVNGRTRHTVSWRWELKTPEGVEPDDLEARRETLRNSSILSTWRQIKDRIEEGDR